MGKRNCRWSVWCVCVWLCQYRLLRSTNVYDCHTKSTYDHNAFGLCCNFSGIDSVSFVQLLLAGIILLFFSTIISPDLAGARLLSITKQYLTLSLFRSVFVFIFIQRQIIAPLINRETQWTWKIQAGFSVHPFLSQSNLMAADDWVNSNHRLKSAAKKIESAGSFCFSSQVSKQPNNPMKYIT